MHDCRGRWKCSFEQKRMVFVQKGRCCTKGPLLYKKNVFLQKEVVVQTGRCCTKSVVVCINGQFLYKAAVFCSKSSSLYKRFVFLHKSVFWLYKGSFLLKKRKLFKKGNFVRKGRFGRIDSFCKMGRFVQKDRFCTKGSFPHRPYNSSNNPLLGSTWDVYQAFDTQGSWKQARKKVRQTHGTSRAPTRPPQGKMQGKFTVNARQTWGDGKGKTWQQKGKHPRERMAKAIETQRKKQGARTCICVFWGVAGLMQFLTLYLKRSDVRTLQIQVCIFHRP